MACGGEDDEANLSTLELFVAAEFFHHGVSGNGIRQHHRQTKMGEQAKDPHGVGFTEACAHFREEDGSAEPEGNGLAVKHLAVGNGGFDAVADGVAEVQQGAFAGAFLLIGLDDAGNQSTVSPGPAVALMVVLKPKQMVLSEPAAGVAGSPLTVTVTWAQATLTHSVVVLRARA